MRNGEDPPFGGSRCTPPSGLRGSLRSTASRSDPSGTCLDKLPRGTRFRLRPMGQWLNRTFSFLRPQPHSRSPRSLRAAPSMFRSGSPLSPPPQPGDLPPLERRSTPSRRRSLRSRGQAAAMFEPALVLWASFAAARGKQLELQARRRWSEGAEVPKHRLHRLRSEESPPRRLRGKGSPEALTTAMDRLYDEKLFEKIVRRHI